MIRDVVACLRCPVCRAPLDDATRALRCPRGHSFDVARQGYVDLSAGRLPHSGDSAGMVAAREGFLRAGHFAAVSAALAAYARPGPVVDVGGGTGHHLAAVLDAHEAAVGLTLDASKPALRRAARAHPRAAAALCDAWGPLPVADGAAALVLDVFAPRNGAEFRRILRPDGLLLVVTPDRDHLTEAVDLLGLLRVDPAKEERLAASLDAHLSRVDGQRVRTTLALGHDDVAALVGMGPSAWHQEPDRLAERIAALPEPFAVTVSVRLAVYEPRAPRSAR
jgi:23S rRNA (guanine745-N1)-methyltransferase